MKKTKPYRRSIRLQDWDYRSTGYYFITICTYQRYPFFADPQLNEIAASTWRYIPKQPHASHVNLDEMMIMPDHMHGILQITDEPEIAGSNKTDSPALESKTIGAIVGNYKMLVTKRVKSILKASGTDMRVWQRGYWERIIRDERELNATRAYIKQNPIRWQANQDNLDKLLTKMCPIHKTP